MTLLIGKNPATIVVFSAFNVGVSVQPLEYCRLKTQASHSSFLSAFRFLPEAKRDALTVLYAYCRELDDAADDIADAQIAAATLAWWRADLAKVFENNIPEHPVCQALVPVVVAFALPKNELEAVIDGMEMDVSQVRYADFDALKRYCYLVAGVVGRLVARILGFTQPETLHYADTLGLALQLTNIIRDVGEDALRKRIYLPIDELQRFDVPANTILQRQPTPEFEQLMAFQINRARAIYREAMKLLPSEDYKSQKVGLVIGSIYYALLQEIQRDGVANVLKYKIAIPAPRKKRIALKTWLFGFRP